MVRSGKVRLEYVLNGSFRLENVYALDYWKTIFLRNLIFGPM